ncbi:MAG TPA: hypothetical protein VN154_07395 [Rhizomicrobium sp.]|nr:hypothetical protein [Rhizomicrobium sp.]
MKFGFRVQRSRIASCLRSQQRAAKQHNTLIFQMFLAERAYRLLASRPWGRFEAERSTLQRKVSKDRRGKFSLGLFTNWR